MLGSGFSKVLCGRSHVSVAVSVKELLPDKLK